MRTARVELLQRHVYLVVRRRRPPLAQIRAHFGERGLNVGEVKVLRRRERERGEESEEARGWLRWAYTHTHLVRQQIVDTHHLIVLAPRRLVAQYLVRLF